jgi:K+-sensing histidine kinase KdpD
MAACVACSGVALLLCVLMNDGWEFRVAAPMLCLQAVIVVSLLWGRMAGLSGAIGAGITFAIWLFPPLGRLAIRTPEDRVILCLFQLMALAIVLLSPRDPSRELLGTRVAGSMWRGLSRRGKKKSRVEPS